MKITPALVIESIPRAAKLGYFRPSAQMDKVATILGDAVLFQFPDIDSLAEHSAFAVDLYERGLFKLPFPATAVAVERDLGPPLGRRGGMVVLIEQAGNTIGAVSCAEVDDDRRSALPIGICVHASFSRVGQEACDARGNTAQLASDAVLRAMYGADAQKALEILHHRLINNVLNAMGLVVMLMSKGVSTERIAASEKLNRAREKRGKPRLTDRYVVSLDLAGARTIYTEGGGAEDITGHTRGSPRPHWRRGFFRCLNRGTERERVVPVAPTLVAAAADSLVTRAVYRVRDVR